MSHIPNYNVLIKELVRVRESAVPTFWWLEDEIYKTYELVNELIYSLWNIDDVIEKRDFNQAIEIGTRLESLANRLFSLDPDIKRVFTSEDTTVTWRRSTTKNIVQAIESEARLYVEYFRPFVSTDLIDDLSPEDKDALSVLRTQIRLRVARDGNKESDVVADGTPPSASPSSDGGPYLGLVFHHDSTVSRNGSDYKHIPSIHLAPQPLRLLKFIHDAGKRGRTVNELVPAIVANKKILTTEKSRLNLSEIDIDLGPIGQYVVRCTRPDAL